MLMWWHKAGINAMVLIIAFLAALGLHGGSTGSRCDKPCTMEQSQVMQTETQL